VQRMKYEETVLQKAFPEYETYKATTARVIPRVY
jgi:protein-S-isoprenylcysteine O-methyltransferase Ste14